MERDPFLEEETYVQPELWDCPLDEPVEPVVDWPKFTDMGEYLDRE